MADQVKEIILPKGITKEVYEKAREIIESGFNAGVTEDGIKTAMFENGIPFSDLMRLYKRITIDSGLVMSSKDIADGIDNAMKGEVEAVIFSLGENTDTLSFDMLQPIVEKVKSLVKSATEKRILAAIKKIVEAHDLQMPVRAKSIRGSGSSAGGGKIATVIADVFADNKETTIKEFEEAISAVTTAKSTKKWCRMFKLFSTLANGKGSKGLA